MDVFDIISERHSVRKFLDSPVEWEKISQILEAGRLAPSAGNVQDWKFIVITEPELRKKVAESALKQYWISKAPVIIIICSDIDKIKRQYGVRGERLYSIQDCAIAATYMILTAHSLGLATCWVGAFEENLLQRALSIPDNSRPQVILPIGYPDEKPKPTYRLRLENMVYLNGYGNVHRIKDMGGVLWDHNILGRTIKVAKETAKDIDKITKEQRQTLSEKFKAKKEDISKKLKERSKH